MIANFFNKTKPVVVIILIMLFALFYFISTLLFHPIVLNLAAIGYIIGVFLCFIFLILVFNFVLRKNNLTEDNSYALLITILLLGSFYEAIFNLNIFFSNLFLLLAFRKLYSFGTGVNTKNKLFDAGFWIGISTVIYTWSFLFLPLILIGTVVYRKVNLKNLFIPLVGFITPILLFFTYHFTLDTEAVFYDKLNLDFSLNFVSYNSLKLLIPITLLITLLIWCIVSLIPKVILISNNFKLAWKALMIHLLIAAIIVVFSPVKNGSELFFMIFPSSIIIANYLQKTSSLKFRNLILYLLLAISISVYFL